LFPLHLLVFNFVASVRQNTARVPDPLPELSDH